MAASINASTSAGVVTTADTTGNLNLQSNGTTVLAMTSAGVAVTGTQSVSGAATITGNLNTGARIVINAASTTGAGAVDICMPNSVFLRGQNTGTSSRSLIGVDAGNYMFLGENALNGVLISSASGVDVDATHFGIRLGYPGSNYWVSYASSTGSYNQFVFGNGNGTVGGINTNGSTTSFNTSSDYRLKEEVLPMTGALATVAKLKPVTFKWKVDGADGQGFIAHELQAIVPDCVTGEKDAVDAKGQPDYQSVDTSFLIATLTAAIQELTARIAALEAK